MSGQPGEEGGFLSRWARRKVAVRTGVAPAETAPPAPVELLNTDASADAVPSAAAAPVAEAPPPPAAPLPTLDDVARLTRESDYSRFVAPGVEGNVRNAAMKKLFTDPHFNVMDGLDTYIDDYGKPDPIPPSMLRMLRQSSFLGLFDDDEKSASDAAAHASLASPTDLTPLPATLVAGTAPPAEPEDLAHEDTDLRLQQDDAAGRPGPGQGPGA
ncbi:MAG: hypothetical protein AD742_14390 [Methylibium sp. NZG]|nr:MAG: hypothetical protein AD742_14390 [Methylibium sp. NZG]